MSGTTEKVAGRITAQQFDRIVTASSPMSEVIWGCKAIGAAIGRSSDYVRDTLAKQSGSPVRRKGREYYARRDELDRFYR